MDQKFKTFDEFCKHYGISSDLPVITGVNEQQKKQLIATYIWEKIVETLNNEGLEEPWIPDYSNPKQEKWELWIRYSPSSGWSLDDVGNWLTRTVTHCGARRVFRTKQIGKYAGENLLHFFTDTF